MSNTIKLKRGSGSDPSASDLSIGELAIRTDSGKIFTKKDNGNVAEISGGGISDGNKGDITVSSGGDSFLINSGIIDNANIASNAAIAGTKISPNFGSQAITGTTGTFTGGTLTLGTADSSSAHINSFELMTFNIDTDNDDTNRYFAFYKNGASGSGTELFKIEETGNITATGAILANNGFVAKASTEPQIVIQDSDTGNTGNAAETSIQFRDGGSNLQGQIGFHDVNTSHLFIDTASTSQDILCRVGGSATQLRVDNAGVDVVGNITATGTEHKFTSGTSGDCKLIIEADTDNNNEGDNPLLAFRQDGGIDVSAIGHNFSGSSSVAGNELFISNSVTNGGIVFYTGNSNGYTNGTERLRIATGGQVDIAGNLVVNNFTRSTNGYGVGSTTVISQSRELQNVTLNSSSVTATTQSAGNNTTRVATTAFVSTAIANLVDSAPGTLNTLNELAAALGDDANFSTTVTNSIATKLPLAGGTLTGNLTISNTEPKIFLTDTNNNDDFSIQNQNGYFAVKDESDGQNRLVIHPDGTAVIGGNLDVGAGIDVTGNVIASGNITANNGTVTVSGSAPKITFTETNDNPDYKLEANGGNLAIIDTTNSATRFSVSLSGVSVTGNITVSGTVDGRDVATDGSKLDGIESNATADQTASEILTLLKTVDGSGSGLDADTLDGIGSGSFIRSDVSDTVSGATKFSNHGLELSGHWFNKYFDAANAQNYIHLYPAATSDRGTNASTTDIRAWTGSTFKVLQIKGDSNDITWGGSKLWTAANDGSGSGLDSDLLDGVQGSSYLRSDSTDTATGALTLTRELTFSSDDDGIFLFGGGRFYKKSGSGVTIRLHDANTPLKIENNSGTFLGNVFHSGNDGAGSGLDSDLLDGQEGSYYRNAGNLNAGTLLAARLGTASASEAGISVVGNFGQWQGHTTYNNFNTEPAYWGWNFVHGNTNAPNTTSSQWYRCRLSLGSEYGKGSDSGDYSLEMALPRSSHASAGVLHIRTIENGTEGSWTVAGSNASLITTGTLPAARLPNHSASLLTSGTIPAARVPTLNQNTTGNAATASDAALLDGLDSSQFLRSDASDSMVGNFTLDGNFNMSSGHVINHNNTASRDKIRVWNSSAYAIGMDNAMSFGGLNDYAMTFQMNSEADRGWVFLDNSHSDAQGAMSLTTNGKLAVAHSIRLGYGESDTTTPGATYRLDVSGNANISGNIVCSGTIDGADVASMNSKLSGIESGATADQTASEILTLIKTVDGSGSGLDADTLDGISSASFLRSDASDNASENITFADQKGIRLSHTNQTDTNDGVISSGRFGTGLNIVGTQTTSGTGRQVRIWGDVITDSGSKFWNASNDGPGSGLDSDTVDGIQGASLLRSDAADTATGDITFSGGAGAATIAANSDIRFTNGSWTGNTTAAKIQLHSNYLYISGGSNGIIFRENGTNRWQIDGSGHLRPETDSTYNLGSNSVRVANGYFDTLYGDGSNLTGISAGATGGGSDEVFYENDQTVTTNYTITNGKNAMAAGPITINSGVTVTVGSGETLTIV